MPVKVCCKYRDPVILSLITIYLVFCKSKAKYHILCRPPIRQAPGKQQRLPQLRGLVEFGGRASWDFTYTFIKYLTYDNVPTKLLMDSGGGEGRRGDDTTVKTYKAEGSKN